MREALSVLGIAAAAFWLAAMVSFSAADPSWSHSGRVGPISNWGGAVGAWLSDILFFAFGRVAYLFPLVAIAVLWRVLRAAPHATPMDRVHRYVVAAGALFSVVGLCGLASMVFVGPVAAFPYTGGGMVGTLIGGGAVDALNYSGAGLLFAALTMIGASLISDISWWRISEALGRRIIEQTQRWIAHYRQRGVPTLTELPDIPALSELALPKKATAAKPQAVKLEKSAMPERVPPKIEVAKPTPQGQRVEKEKQIPLFTERAQAGDLPPLNILDEPEARRASVSQTALDSTARLVEIKLREFGISVNVVAVIAGPVITRYELELAAGTKASQVTNLAKDLARSLSVISVRVVEVIAGKSVIGVEIPNAQREIVRLSEVLRSQPFEAAASPLTIALGKDIAGVPVVADLGRMPHLLVAGTTGSGKSVAVNAMILSLLYNASPKDVRLIMVDPKMLELSIYEGIPHLLAPVVTDMKDAANALRWCVVEMDRRYKVMSHLGVRQLSGYNKKIEEAAKAGKPITDPTYPLQEATLAPTLEHLPYIVVIIDELADLMMLVGKKVEELIARLAQKARAAGIHLVLATQRPSVDVITGLIKANIPTRVAFQVSSRIDSRTIIDQMGAEQLLGHGDMLFLPPGTGVPMRVHGAYVADQEVHKTVSFLKQQGGPQYLDEVLNPISASDEFSLDGAPNEESDELYDEAVRFVTETRRASISSVQRRFKVGYNRAARMIEVMERAGVVGPVQSNGSREVIAPPPPEMIK